MPKAVRRLLGKVRWGAISRLCRRESLLARPGPIVSFTFDDFPQSALRVGGEILLDHGARGTYYAAMGLMDQTNGLGRLFTAQDLESLIQAGHELGSHTFSHLSCRSVAPRQYELEVLKGVQAVVAITGTAQPHHFSYPFGHVTLRAKARIGARLSSCRGIVPGVNPRFSDRNLLLANSLYSNSRTLDQVRKLFDENETSRGWLIFYTHDVSTRPSEFGCTPDLFAAVVKMASQRQQAILPVGDCVTEEQQANVAVRQRC